jgi:hypothetical protein
MDDPVAFWDQPTEGRRLVVDGMPAIVADDLGDPGTVVRTWKIARPTMFDNWLQLDAGMRGPAQSGALDAVISSIRFDPRPQPLNPAQANQIGNAALAALRADDAEGFACFPPVGQSVVASITAAPGAPLRQPLTATCSTTIAGTDIGFWRMVLVVGWGDDLPGAGFRYTTVQWLLPDGTLSGRSSGGDDALPFCCRG